METVAYYSYCKKCTFTYEGIVNLYYYKQKVYIFLNLFKKKSFKNCFFENELFITYII